VYVGAIIHPRNADFAKPLQFDPETFDDESDKSETEVTHPPKSNRAPGRPKKHRVHHWQELNY